MVFFEVVEFAHLKTQGLEVRLEFGSSDPATHRLQKYEFYNWLAKEGRMDVDENKPSTYWQNDEKEIKSDLHDFIMAEKQSLVSKQVNEHLENELYDFQ